MISIIIPTFNEAQNIAELIHYLKKYSHGKLTEIIVSDGGSIDDTMSIASAAGAKAVLSTSMGRAAQMNYGASLAKSQILYFIHADTFPPETYCADIESAVNHGFSFGRYRTRFNSTRKILLLNAFFTRFDWFMCYGGDQTLFMTTQLFSEIGGFNAALGIMEDYEIIVRAKAKGKYKIFISSALISARKYDNNTYLRVQRANYHIIQMYKKGASQKEMISRYKAMLDYR
ncbi:MAG: TIGR04283 family arsenosugar biosynthesis glycosyltransferase [Flavitalea sp.]